MGRIIAFLICFPLIPLVGASQIPDITIDPSKGEIDGKVAVSFWAHKPQDPQSLLDPAPYKVHLVPASDQDIELLFPAGKWFQPPPDQYRAWVEGPDTMSQGTVILNYSGGRFRGRGLAAGNAVYPAGRVMLATDVASSPSTVLRLLHLDSHNRAKYPQREMSRRVPASRLHTPVLMPEGRILAALVDNKSREYVAISRPVQVTRDRTATVRPEPPVEGSHLLVVLNRAGLIGNYDEYDVELAVSVNNVKHSADIRVPTADRIYAVWYGLQGNYARLEVVSQRGFLLPQEIVLRPGKVESFKGELRPLPSVEAHIELPWQLAEEPLALAAFRFPERELVKREPLAPGTIRHRLPRLPASELEVVLELGAWEFRRRVDLSDGETKTTVFQPTPIYVDGTVYRGKKPHPAVLTFSLSGGQGLEVETDEAGRYEGLLFQPTYLVSIQLGEVKGPPYVELFDQPIGETTVRDFHLPDNAYRVRVRDVKTGAGIGGAQVSARIVTPTGKTTNQNSTTDDEGVAKLQPMPPGKLGLMASAKGYLPSPDPITHTIAEEASADVFEVFLEPKGETAVLVLLLPNAVPAASAEVAAWRGLEHSHGVWAGISNRKGEIRIPSAMAGNFLLVRHTAAGFLVRPWTDENAEPVVWQLPPAAPPLRLRALDAGQVPVPWARLALWVGGMRLSGPALGWLTTSHSATNADGFWHGNNLPASSLRVVAWKMNARDLGRNGTFDTLASTVSFPWQATVTIEAFD